MPAAFAYASGGGVRAIFMNNIEIKQAGPDDCDLLMKWRMDVLREVFSLSPDGDLTDLYAQNLSYYRRALTNGSHIACFALYGGRVVGCGGLCLQQEMPSPDNPTGRCAYLMNIYVPPNQQKGGIGTAIVNWLVARAKERGIPKIYLEASGAGCPLYKKLGFVPMEHMMILEQ